MARIDFQFHTANDGTNHQTLFVNQIQAKCPQFAPNIDACLMNGINIEEIEFFTYALFEDFNINNPFFNSFRGFEDIATTRKDELNRIFSVAQTIKFRYPGTPNVYIAYAGCGIALSVANNIFNITNADYIRIPERPGRPRRGANPGANRTLDFEYIGTDGNRFLRIECKGKAGIDGNIQDKINHILTKKVAQPAGTRDFSFGIIATLPVEPDARFAQCILVDPDIPDYLEEPSNFRLSARLRYYANRLTNLGNSKWVQNIKQLFFDNNSREYSNVIINKKFDMGNQNLADFLNINTSRKITNGYYFKCSVIETEQGRILGRISQTSETNFYFYGFIESLFEEIQYKTINSFLEYKNNESVINWNGIIRVWDGYIGKYDIMLNGDLLINNTGEVSGVLSILKDN